MPKFALVLEYQSEERARYALKVSSHGGTDTHANHVGVCGKCGTVVYSNVEEVICPECGKHRTLGEGLPYKEWHRQRGKQSDGCRYIHQLSKPHP